jgi:hypothetical protein
MHVRDLAVTAFVLLASGTASAQSLDETYAAMCGDAAAAQGEACVVMAKALAAKTPGQGEPVGEARWGVFAGVVDQPLIDLLVESPEMQLFEPGVLMYKWEVPGEVMAVTARQADGTYQKVSTMRWDGARRGLVDSSMPADGPGLLAWQPDGSFVMDLDGARVTYSPLPDNVIELRGEVDRGQGMQVLWVQHRVRATPANIKAATDNHALMKQVAANQAASQALIAEIERRDAELKASPLWQQTLINRANAEAERERKRQARANGGGFMAALNGMLDAGLEVAHAREAQSRYELDSTLANINSQIVAQQAGQVPQAASTPPVQAGIHPVKAPNYGTATAASASPAVTAGSGASASAAAKPLRFVLTIGMRNLPGDAHNPTCYSNVVTRPGPPGWGAPGFLPTGSAEQARTEIESLKSRFIGLCRASGREITGEGDFSYVWNRSADDEARVQDTAPRHAVDVAVSL